jgi:hypothetical protein
MKKSFGLVFLIVVLGLLPISAGVNKVSIAGLYSMSGGKESVTMLGITSEAETKSSGIGLKVQGTSFFSPASDIGISYKISAVKTLSASADSVSIDTADIPLIWGFGVGAAYQIPTSADMFVEVGAGVDYLVQSKTSGGVTSTVNLFAIAANAEINYAINNNLFFDAGIALNYPLGGSVSASGGGTTISGDFTSSVFTFSPYIGVSIAY